MTATTSSRDLTQTMLAVIFIGAMIAGSLWVLRPFLPALIWATMIVIATWPLMRLAQERLWGRRGLAVALMTVVLLLLFIIPLWVAIATVVEHASEVTHWAKSLQTVSISSAPEWVKELPWLGPKFAAKWERLAAEGKGALVTRLSPYVGTLLRWFVSQLGGLGGLFVHFLLTVVIAAILYFKGEFAAAGVRSFSRRLGGTKGENAAVLASQAIRAVALGVMVTALVQSVAAGIGLAIAGIPQAFLLTTAAFILSVIQVGSAPVLLVATIWTYAQGDAGWGTFLLVWTVLVGSIDNFLRPFLIKRGANLPLLLIFAGVLGGLLAFGAIGLFVGPVVLAVTYTLLESWVTGVENEAVLDQAP